MTIAMIQSGGPSPCMRQSLGAAHKALVAILGITLLERGLWALAAHKIVQGENAKKKADRLIFRHYRAFKCQMEEPDIEIVTMILRTPSGILFRNRTVGASQTRQQWALPCRTLAVDETSTTIAKSLCEGFDDGSPRLSFSISFDSLENCMGKVSHTIYVANVNHELQPSGNSRCFSLNTALSTLSPDRQVIRALAALGVANHSHNSAIESWRNRLLFLQDKAVLITDSRGFIGASIVDLFLKYGVEIRTLPGAQWYCVKKSPAGFQSFSEILDGLVQDIDVVIHLAGPSSVATSFNEAPSNTRDDIAGTANVLHTSCRVRVKRLIYIFSAEFYGRPQADPVSESHSVIARSPYAAAKIDAEQFVLSFAHAFGLEVVILRPFSIHTVLETTIRLADAPRLIKVEQKDRCHFYIARHFADIRKMVELNFSPQYSVADSIADLVRYYSDIIFNDKKAG